MSKDTNRGVQQVRLEALSERSAERRLLEPLSP